MNSHTPQISRESIWILSNIAAGTEEHVTRLFSVRGMAENIFQHCKDNLPKKRKVNILFVNMIYLIKQCCKKIFCFLKQNFNCYKHYKYYIGSILGIN